ncbi:S-methyl-5-thioribose-1-phosphate isomerase [Candidatus Geothermarchaeota archaeon]|nr:MAG: S-methyl-5-thioribose-1-phosphate isomerase [Candidatus Geothermarchaeota archaeon]
MPLKSIEWLDGTIRIIDQNKLPEKLVYEELKTLKDVIDAIKDMKVRGAPLLGVTAALALALEGFNNRGLKREEIIKKLKEAGKKLLKTRPTAVNLKWAIERVLSGIDVVRSPVEVVIDRALKIYREDIEVNRRIGLNGQTLIEDGDAILTHCNTGSLATVSLGTALGVIITAHSLGKRVRVLATETRPKLQGARLTMFELKMEGIDATLIPDTAVGYVMRIGKVKKVIVGADRILKDGTTYNKIGTYQIAVLAKHHGIPFYVAAPTSTFDLKSSREEVKIEERDWHEVAFIGDKRIAPEGVKILNPAFDETPPELISAIITEKGIVYPPYNKNIRNLFK